MIDILDNFDIRNNFWEVNPSFLAVKVFRSFYSSDKTKDKARSSSTMWAISLLVHPRSKFANASYEDRLRLINDDFLDGKFTISPEKEHEELIDSYKKYCVTRTQRIAVQWGDKLDERFKFMDTVPYDDKNVDMLDKMMASTEKLWKQYMVCLKDLEDEASASQVMGGATESLSEQGKI